MTFKSRSIPVEYIKECLEYREEVVDGVLQGNVYWKYRENRAPSWNNRFAGKKAGCKDHTGYYNVTILYNNLNCKIRLHTIIWILCNNQYPVDILDHKDRNKSNNIISNLRKANKYLNNINVPSHQNKSSQYKGVSFSQKKGKWICQHSLNYKRIGLGSFNDEIEAAINYNKETAKVRPIEYCYLNDISNGYTNKEYPNMPRGWKPEEVAA